MSTETEQTFQFKELDKFAMFTDAPGVQNRRSRLQWSSYRGNPRIAVFTGVPDDTNKGVITAPMNPETAMILFDLLDDLRLGAPDRKYKVENYTLPKAEEGEKRSSEKIHLSDTWIGKDKEGVLWISVRAPNRPTIVFKFTVSDFHKLFKGNGEQLTEAEASCLQAKAVVENLRAIFQVHSAELRPPFDAEAAKARRAGGGGGYGNRGGGQQRSGGGSTNAFSDLTDDIPY